MNKILYEAHYQLSWPILIAIVMIICLAFFPRVRERSFAKSGKELSKKEKRFARIICTFGIVFASFALGVYIETDIDVYEKAVGAYKKGEYEIVEGYVENFVPMPKEGHARESFEIGGIYFEYSEGRFSSAYSHAKVNGGVIRGNGQHLKVGYVNDWNYGNMIVYIEELASQTK